MPKNNGFEIENNVVRFFVGEQSFIIDLDDYPIVSKYKWHIYNGYVRSSKGYLHRIITKCPNNKVVDHINHNTLDNRKENLRPATTFENAQNHSKQRNNTSGIIGVYYRSKDAKWCAQINIHKKRIYLGSFDKKEDAIIVRLKAESTYFKEFSSQKHLFEAYGLE